ncbi:MAG: MFS transporter, partial [Micromonosporaceae bacterium]
VPLPPQSLLADLADGWAEVRSRTWYWSSLIAHACWNFAAGVFATLGPLLVVRHLGGEASWIALLQAGAVGLVVGSLIAGRYRPRRPILVANAGGALYAIPLTLLALTAPAPAVIAGYGVGMVALGFLNPVWDSAVQQRVPQQALARVMSYDWLISIAAMPLGYLAGPVLADLTTPAVPLLGAAALVAAATLGTALVPDVRRQTNAPARELVPA